MGKTLAQIFLVIVLNFLLLIPAQAAPIGMNVAAPRDLINSEALVDLFKTAEGWFTSCRYDWQRKRPIDPGCVREKSFNTGEQNKLILDQQGWVKSFGRGGIFTSIKKSIRFPDNFKPGRFILDYAGDGDIKVIGGAQHIRVVSQSPNYIVVDLLSGNKRNIQFEILYTNPNNYIRNMRFYREKNKSIINTNYFNQAYVNKIAGFKIIRFMPWGSMRTNTTDSWASANKPNVSSYIGPKGIPEDLMLRLANRTGAHPWFSLPYRVNDNYIESFAKHVKQHLNPNAKIYLEYSNEVWNGIFQGTGYARKQALKVFPGWQNNFLKRGIKGQAANETNLGINYYSQRTVQMCQIWKRVFGNQSHRVKCVLSSYVGVPVFSDETLACPLMAERTGKSCASQVDYFAVGPYFGHYVATINYRAEFTAWANNPAWGLDSLFQELFTGGVLKKKNEQGRFLAASGQVASSPQQYVNAAPRGGMQKTIDEIAGSAKVAKKFNIPMISYEGGQSIVRYDGKHRLQTKRDHKIIQFITRANKDLRMQQAYQRYLDAWGRITGGQAMMHFSGLTNSGEHPFFGIFDSVDSATSPKWRAFQNYSRQTF